MPKEWAKTVSLRLTGDELAQLEMLRDKLSSRVRVSSVRVSYKSVMLEALECLNARLRDLDRKR